MPLGKVWLSETSVCKLCFLHLSGEAKTVESPVNLGPSEDLHDGHFLLEGAVVLGA